RRSSSPRRMGSQSLTHTTRLATLDARFSTLSPLPGPVLSRPGRASVQRVGWERTMAEFRRNPAKQKLDNGGVVTLVMGDYSPDMVEFLGQFGFDAVLGEQEHFTTSWRDIANLSRACDLWGMMSMVRINSNDPGLITRALDCGANGIMVPHVNTADEARLVATSARYGPLGNRGQFGGRRSFGVLDYHRLANENVMTSILIEDIVAIRNLPEILTVDGIDVFY